MQNKVTIQHRVQNGIKWTSTSLIITQMARFVANIILARILVPEMFGIMAIANTIITTTKTIREFGLGIAYIQKQYKDDIQDRIAANTTFLLSLGFNVSIFLMCYAVSNRIGYFFASDELTKILKVLFISFLLDAITTVPRITLQKKMLFARIGICEIARSSSNALIAIILALQGMGIWSLALGHLFGDLIFVPIIWAFSGWRPRVEFNFTIAKELFAYGKFIWAQVLMDSVGHSLDKWFIGKFLGVVNLGFYAMAITISRMPVNYFGLVINRVTFPAFSKIQDNLGKLRKGYLKTLAYTSMITIPLAIGVAAAAEPIILTIYGSKWRPVIPLVEVLAFYGVIISIISTMSPFFKAIGKPNILLYTNITQYMIMIPLFFLFLRSHGILGICYAVTISALFALLILFRRLSILLKFTARELISPIFKAGLSSAAMFLLVRFCNKYLASFGKFQDWILLLNCIMVGVAGYFTASLLFNKSCLVEVKNTFAEFVLGKDAS